QKIHEMRMALNRPLAGWSKMDRKEFPGRQSRFIHLNGFGHPLVALVETGRTGAPRHAVAHINRILIDGFLLALSPASAAWGGDAFSVQPVGNPSSSFP